MFNDETAREYLQKMYRRMVPGWGHCHRTLEAIADRCGLTVWNVKHILEGRNKSIKTGHWNKIRAAYLQFLREERDAIDAEIAFEDERSEALTPENFIDQIEALQARLEEIKKGLSK